MGNIINYFRKDCVGMNQIERVIRSGFSTVSAVLKARSSSPSSPFETPNWTILQQNSMIDALGNCTASDVNLFESVDRTTAKAPVAFMHIYENNWFSIGVFVIFEGCRLPLHDHPGMFGVIKTICGKVRVKSYSIIESSGSLIKAHAETPVELDRSSNPVSLQPNDKNIHEIEFIQGESDGERKYPYAAFIDFLSPPYKEDMSKEPCNYYEMLALPIIPTHEILKPIVTLRKCPPPHSYWSTEAPYMGQSFKTLAEQLEREYPKSCL